MTIDTMSIIISGVSLLVGIVLSVVAILLSIYFFSRSKDAQTDTSNTLTKLNTQVDQLSNINDKLFGRALTSLSQIAKQKVSADSTAVAEQAAAAVKVAMAAIPDLALITERRAEERDRPPEAPGSENQISGHSLPNIPDPFTLADLKREYVAILVFFLNSTGWLNNYGQQALMFFTQHGADPSLINETGDNLNNSAKFYKGAKQRLIELQERQPDLFDGVPAKAQIDAITERLDLLVRTYDEAAATLLGDAAPGA